MPDIDLSAGIPVLHLDKTDRSKTLRCLQSYATSTQHDHATVDWDGFQRGGDGGSNYIQVQIQRRLGYVRAQNGEIPYGERRPTVTSSIGGMIVDTFSDVLTGEGRTPSITVQGDEATSAYLTTVFESSGSWTTLAACRDLAGSCGESAFLPLIHDNKPAAETLNPADLYVEWTNKPGWIPSLVIEQRKIVKQEYDEDEQKVVPVEYWRTRAWDEANAYLYCDIRCDGQLDHKADGPDVKAPDDGPLNVASTAGPSIVDGTGGTTDDGEPPEVSTRPDIADVDEVVAHGAGRCPVVWYQNEHNDDDSRGRSDYESCEDEIDALDRLLAMLMRGSTANADPTVVRKDKWMAMGGAGGGWPWQGGPLRKGYGAKIDVSEVGSVEFLEVSGASYEQGWNSFKMCKGLVEDRCGVVIVTPETAGSYKSGVALQVLMGRQNSRAGRKRRALDDVVKQAARVWLALGGAHTVGKMDIPLRKIVDREANREDRFSFEPHAIGEGRWVQLDWPPYQDPSPTDIAQTVTAMVTANGGRAVLSHETSIRHTVGVIGGDDALTELDRLADENGVREAGFDEGLDIEGAEDLVAGGPDGLGEDGAPTDTGEQVQHEAMNGIQVKTLGDTLARTGNDLAPETARFTINEGFPNTRGSADLETAITAQMEMAAQTKAEMGDATGQLDAPASGKGPVGAGADEMLSRQDEPEDDEDDTDFELE